MNTEPDVLEVLVITLVRAIESGDAKLIHDTAKQIKDDGRFDEVVEYWSEPGNIPADISPKNIQFIYNRLKAIQDFLNTL